jgi:hypothetical protein
MHNAQGNHFISFGFLEKGRHIQNGFESVLFVVASHCMMFASLSLSLF